MLIDLTPPQTELITWFVKRRNSGTKCSGRIFSSTETFRGMRASKVYDELLAKLDEMLNREKDEGRRRAGR